MQSTDHTTLTDAQLIALFPRKCENKLIELVDSLDPGTPSTPEVLEKLRAEMYRQVRQDLRNSEPSRGPEYDAMLSMAVKQVRREAIFPRDHRIFLAGILAGLIVLAVVSHV